MQVIWFEFEEGMSWFRQEKFGLALKRFTDLEKQFLDIHSDQVDFHNFCHRKMTLRQYVRMLRLEDKLLGHEFYFKAACKIVKIYLHLYANPITKTGVSVEEEKTLSETEKRKLQRKLKKEKLKQQQEEAKKQQERQKSTKNNKLVDTDPNGEKLLNVADPLSEAHKYITQLLKFSDNHLETHLLGYQVALHRKKYLLALRSVLKGLKFDPNNPEVHYSVVKLFHTVSTANLHPNVKNVIEIEKHGLLQDKTLAQFNDAYLAVHGGSVAGRRVHFESALLIGSHKKEQLLKNLEKLDDPDFPLEECIKVYKILQKEFGEDKAEEYKSKCQGVFPYARFFFQPKRRGRSQK